MQFCPECGTKNEANAQFCGGCGGSLQAGKTSEPKVVVNNYGQQQSNVIPASVFDGTVWQFIGYSILMWILSVITLGLATPWIITMFWKWEIGHTNINGKRLKFTGHGGGLFLTWLKIVLLSIITLGIYSFWGYVVIKRWKVKNTVFV